MRVEIKGLNSNEVYCCKKSDIKAVFGDTDINVYFGVLNIRRDERSNSVFYRPDKKCKARIIAQFIVHKRYINRIGTESEPRLKFFILEKSYYTEELHLKFVTEVLPELRRFYEIHKDDDPIINHGEFSLTIGLKDDNFNFYETLEGKT